MANVFLTDEAYARLKASKKKGQSFSDWVLENAQPQIDWEKYIGAWKEVDVDALKRQIKKERR